MAVKGILLPRFAWAGYAAIGALLLAISLVSGRSSAVDRSAFTYRVESRVLQAESQEEFSKPSLDDAAPRELVPAPEFRVLGRDWTNVREPKKEKDFYSAFLRFARHSDGSLEREAELSLKGKGPNCEKIAALRALYDGKSARAPEFFLYAIQNFSDGSRRAQGEPIPSFAVRFLREKAACDPRAREILEKLIWMDAGELPLGFRQLASTSLARHGTEAELCRLVSSLSREKDGLFTQETLAALSENENATRSNCLLGLLGGLAPSLSARQNVGE